MGLFVLLVFGGVLSCFFFVSFRLFCFCKDTWSSAATRIPGSAVVQLSSLNSHKATLDFQTFPLLITNFCLLSEGTQASCPEGEKPHWVWNLPLDFKSTSPSSLHTVGHHSYWVVIVTYKASEWDKPMDVHIFTSNFWPWALQIVGVVLIQIHCDVSNSPLL